ncbi:NTP transferase domain-containing protein [Neobacillus sp. SuZ13]|uniref:NTP transferase domain-containing protein n=1 Tax=Neobacillus sp. SuZ13 TaxID=3047875 RepID=UPI0024C005E2|nr:NTP transferase domain-containing protein [Neobacillus sp. SuZ13]WHY67912.1 NTP transferase domain-containing protein [Neobacillus sp. SuZ13]
MNYNAGVIAVCLAAGKSQRMGINKLALPWGKRSIGQSVLEKAVKSELSFTIVVTREADHLHWIERSLFQTPLQEKWKAVICQDSDLGQAHSLHTGLREAMEMEPKGIMILLADQPLLPVKIINDLVFRYMKGHHQNIDIPFLAASFQGIPRPPIIFSTKVVPDLLKLEGDEGARQLFRKSQLTGKLVDYENSWDFFDVDTKEDYEILKGVGTSSE